MDAAFADLLASLESSGLAQALRTSRWGYPLLNIGHLLGVALLFGAIVPLDLRALGAWRSVDPDALSQVLVPVAALGFATAVTTGLILFSVRASDYAGMALFWTKMGLVLLGGANALLIARRGLSPGPALLSVVCWVAAIACGRLLGYLTS